MCLAAAFAAAFTAAFTAATPTSAVAHFVHFVCLQMFVFVAVRLYVMHTVSLILPNVRNQRAVFIPDLHCDLLIQPPQEGRVLIRADTACPCIRQFEECILELSSAQRVAPFGITHPIFCYCLLSVCSVVVANHHSVYAFEHDCVAIFGERRRRAIGAGLHAPLRSFPEGLEDLKYPTVIAQLLPLTHLLLCSERRVALLPHL
mmetsp:Transcript_44129/g.115966  ORF Transcript_44129/g.115966 Transcript_44129/m.115966 type:complete len:203 (+) Transcript_44129:973-1581(+)